jgi:AcrR family transcriptional regulator
MARSGSSGLRRRALVAELARAFAEQGFRRATTAELARRCGVQETILYRLWPGKREMFVAAIEHVFAESEAAWATLLGGATAKRGAARKILAYEASHHGEHGLYRLVFAGLSECDDPEVRAALRRMYGRFHRFVAGQVALHRGGGGGGKQQVAEAAWAIVGLGTVANLTRELGLLGSKARAQLIERVGALLLGSAG